MASLRTKTMQSVPTVAAGDSATTIENLVEAIRKHKKFKQLASYNIQCLERPLSKTHNRTGWETAARTAFELGAFEELAESCARFASDAEYFRMCMQCLVSMSNIPKCMPAVMAHPEAAANVVNAVKTYMESIDMTSSMLPDSLAIAQPSFALFQQMNRQDAAAFSRAGGMDLLVSVAGSESRPKLGTSATSVKNYETYAAFIGGAMSVLEKGTRTKPGLDALNTKPLVTKLLKVCVLNLAAAGDAGKAAPRTPVKADRNAGAGVKVDVNAHLEHGFRILDRLARADSGRDTLLACGATSSLSPIMSTVLKMPAVAPLAMRVLARLLGSNIPALIDRVAGDTKPPVDLQERILCARLLGFILKDDESVGQLLANDATLLRRLVKIVQAAPLAGTDGAAAVFSAFKRIADASTENIPVLEEVGALSAAVATLSSYANQVDLTAEVIAFLASAIDCHEMVELLSALDGTSAFSLALKTALPLIGNAAVATAVLNLIEKAMFYDADPSGFVSAGAVKVVVSAMKLVSSAELQLLGTDVLIYLAVNSQHIDEMVANGVIDVVIKNLVSSHSEEELSGPSAAAGGDEDDDAAISQVQDKRSKAVSGQLVASTLYLITSICAVDRHVASAKTAGIIKAVLSGFSRHIHDPIVYRNFREVISALHIEEREVVQAIASVAAWSMLIQENYPESEVFKTVEDFVHHSTAEGCQLFASKPKPPASEIRRTEKGDIDLNSAAEHLLEHISLLEAVTVSPVFVCVISVHDGVPALLHVLGTVSVLRMLSKEQVKAASHGGVRSITQQQGIVTSIMDDVLARTCNTLAHLARVAYEFAGGQVEQDPEYEPIDFAEFDIDGEMYNKEHLYIIAKAMSTAAKPQLKQFAVASVTLLSWLASGQTLADSREHAEALIGVQGIEAIVSMLRAHQGALDICAAVAGALTRIAITPKGASAVATRGGSRQVVRTLHATASLRSNRGDELLLAYLRLLDTIAAAGAEPVDILRRQGTVDAVVRCIYAGTERDFQVDVQDDTKPAGASEAAYVPDAGVRQEIDTTITSLLSRLTTPDLITQTVSDLTSYVSYLEGVVNASTYNGKVPIQMPDIEPGAIFGAVVRLGLLSKTGAGKDAGEEVLTAGAIACAKLAALGLKVSKLCTENGTLQPRTIEAELDAAAGASFRTIKQLNNAVTSLDVPTEVRQKCLERIANVTMPTLFIALEDKPEYSSDVLSTASAFSSVQSAADSIIHSHGGSGLHSLIDVLRSASEKGEEVLVRDTFLTLAGVAAKPENINAVVDQGGFHVALAYLADNINDADADTLGSAFLVLARCSDNSSVVSDLVQGNHIFDLAKTALQRFGNDPYAPKEALLTSAAEMLNKLAANPSVHANPSSAEEFRNTLKRVIKSAACSTGYIDTPRCSTAVLTLIANACREEGPITKEIAELNREAVNSCLGEDLVVQCMSSYAATQDVLAAGYAALQALGAGDKSAQLLEQIDSYAATIPQWLDSGYTVQESQVVDMTAAMSDLMKNLASQIVVNPGQVLDLGAPYSEILATTWRAVAVICRDEYAGSRTSGAQAGAAGGKDIHNIRADALSVAAQIIGRLDAAAAGARSLGYNDPKYSISQSDLVSALYTILAAAHTSVEVRVLESLCKAVEQIVDDSGVDGLHAMCSSKIVAGFMTLLQVVQSEGTKARIAMAGGTLAQSALSIADLQKCEASINNAVKHVTATLKDGLAKPTAATSHVALLEDSDSMSDILGALSLTTIPSTVANKSDDADQEEGATAAPTAAADLSSFTDLQALADGIVSASKLAKKLLPVWNLLGRVAGTIETTMQGPVRGAPQGQAPLYAVNSLQASVRVEVALLRAILQQLGSQAQLPSTPTTVGSAAELGCLLSALNACYDVAWDHSRAGRAKVSAMPASPEYKESYSGGDVEAGAVRSSFSVASSLSGVAARTIFDIVSRMDFSSAQTSCNGPLASPEFVGPVVHALGSKEILTSPTTGVALIHALSSVSDQYSRDVLSGSFSPNDNRSKRLTLLGSAGVYKAVSQSLSVAGVDADYTNAAIQLLSGVSRISPSTATSDGVSSLGLDKSSLIAINAALKRFADEPSIASAASSIVTKLESVYQEQSGAAFESIIKRSVQASAGPQGWIRNRAANGAFTFKNTINGQTAAACPKPFHDFLDALLGIDMMSRSLDEDAVTPVTADALSGLVDTFRTHSHDFGIVGIILNALGKLAANGDNHDAIVNSGVVQLACKKFSEHDFASDPRICEGLASIVLPLSFEQHFVKSVLTEADVIPIMIAAIKRFQKTLCTYAGSPTAWLLDSQKDHNVKVAAMVSDAMDAEERNKLLPRLAQMCVQSLANLACDNEAGESGVSSVERIVVCGGIETLGELMSHHPDNPRLLEDSICALSNMAFVSDKIQLAVGQSCMDTVCAAATNFNADSYLFQMTLRAIGNLTRVDENIMRAVGYGVIRGMVEGMSKHAEDPAVLQLCADVIGNMASVDDKKVGREAGVRILTDCSGKRKAATPAAPTANSAGLPPAPATPAPPKTPKPAAKSHITTEALIAVVEKAKNLKEAVCTVLYEDGAPRALVTAMTKHYRNADLAGSCLRALHYIGASAELVGRMVNELGLVDQVVFIMRSIDYRPDVLRRGARVLGLVVGTENLKDKVLEAGAPSMLLQAIETHRAERELCISCYSVLAMARSSAVVAAVQEMQAVDTAVNILRQNSTDHEFAGVLLELLWGWAAEADLANLIATKAAPTLINLLQSYATDKDLPERMQQLSYILNLVLALVRQRVDANILVQANLVPALSVVCTDVLDGSDGAVMLSQRMLVMQTVTIFLEIVKPQSKEKDTPASVSKEGVECLLKTSAGALLEKVLTVYKAVPDPRVPGQLLYDQSMCERAYGVLQDMIAHGYQPVQPVVLDAPEDDAAAGPDPAVTASLPPEVKAELDAMTSGGRAVEFWVDGKARKAKITMSPDQKLVSLLIEDGKGKGEFAMNTVKGIVLNVPGGAKKKGGIFSGRQPRPERSLTLLDSSGNTIFHFELDREQVRDSLGQLFSTLCGVPSKKE